MKLSSINLIALSSILVLMQLSNLFEDRLLQITLTFFFYGIAWLLICVNLFSYLYGKYIERNRNTRNYHEVISIKPDKLTMLLFAIYNFVMLIAFATYYLGAFKELKLSPYLLLFWLTINILGILIFWTQKSNFSLNRLRAGILYGLCIYVAVNTFLHIIGIRPTDTTWDNLYGITEIGESHSLSFLGLKLERILFPLSTSINGFGVVSGASLVTGVLLFILRYRSLGMFLKLIIVITSCFALLLSDSRGSLVSAFMTILLYLVFKKSFVYRYFPSLIMFASIPFLLLNTLVIKQLDVISFLARDRGSEILSGREIIWSAVLKILSEFNSNQLFGYGIYGQVDSGVSQLYSFLFSGRLTSPDIAPPHSLLLQYLLDVGYVGTIVFVLLLFTVSKQLTSSSVLKSKYQSEFVSEYANNIKIENITYALVIYFILAGVTEAMPTVYYADSFLIFTMIIISGVFSISSNAEKGKELQA
ncbi:MAG: O-antigen ligase family protein [Aphanocapsa sp. GSE-SYN-MK-11-07L]|jgi:O-antigen ligase|nr:O-antigen ligase family protein [Aphanocapsa sp. GSE-SYN-MK-11-07L]